MEDERRRSRASMASLAFSASVVGAAGCAAASFALFGAWPSAVVQWLGLLSVTYAAFGSALGVVFGLGTLIRVRLYGETMRGTAWSATATALSAAVALALAAGVGILVWALSHMMHGRPFRIDGRPVLAGLRRGARGAPAATPALAGLPAARRAELAAAWAGNALAEHASIAAFERLAAELAAAGAPADLVARARAAGADEVDHTARCFALASAYAGTPLAAGPLPAAAPRGLGLADLAVESLVDGCLHEGFAAALAARARDRATDPAVRGALGAIAADEAAHAALSEDLVRWAVAAGGPPVAAAVRTAAEALPTAPVGATDAVVVAGLVAPAELAATWAAVRTAVARRHGSPEVQPVAPR